MAHQVLNAGADSGAHDMVDVSDLDPQKGRCKVRVRVLRKFNHHDGDDETLDFVFVDVKGDKIHATLKGNIRAGPFGGLEEGVWLLLENYELSAVSGNFRPTPHDFKIVIKPETFFALAPSLGSGGYFSFAGFGDIHRGLRDRDYLVDLIGYVRVVGKFATRDGCMEKYWGNVFVNLHDEIGGSISLLLRRSYSETFLRELSQCTNGVIICVVRFAMIVKLDGVWKAMTAYDCTQVLLDPPYPEVDQLRDRIAMQVGAGSVAHFFFGG